MSVEFKDNSAKILKKFKTATGTALNLIGSQATRHMQDNTPVRTGNLRDHGDWEVSEDESYVQIGFKKDPDPKKDPSYAIYVEEGSINNDANHMIRRAVTENTQEFEGIANHVYRNA